MRKLFLACLLALLPLGVLAQGVAPQAVMGYLSISGCPSATPCFIQYGATIPISGSVTANNASVSATGSAVPASATYVGINVAGTLTGWTGTLSAGTALIGNVGVAIASTTSGQSGPLVQCAVTTSAPTYTTAQTDPLSCDTAGGVRLATLPAGTNLIGVVGNAQASTTSGQSGPLVQCGVTTAAPSYTTAQTDPLSCDTGGALRTRDVATSSTGAAVPASAVYIGSNVGGNVTGNVACNSSVTYDASTNGKTQLVALTSAKVTRVCGYVIFSAGTVNVSLSTGTGTNCGTTSTNITPAFQLTAQTGVSDSSPFWRGLATAASEELCLVTSAGTAVQAVVYYEVH